MKQLRQIKAKKKGLVYLSDYARYLLQNKLADFQRTSLRQMLEEQIPMLHFFDSEELEVLANQGNYELLVSFAENTSEEHTQKSIERWIANQVPKVERNHVVVDDVTLVAHTRRLSLMAFITDYTTNPLLLVELIKEIDLYVLNYTSSAFKAFASIMDERLNDQVLLLKAKKEQYKQAQAITHIGNYTWNLNKNELSWSDELYRIYGLIPGTDSITFEFIASYNHPEDVPKVKASISESLSTLQPFDFYYRIILKDDRIKTLHARGEIFTDAEGIAIEVFGTTQDVTERQTLIEQLQLKEKLNKQVESIAHLGTWSWDVSSNSVTWTDELYRIYGLEPQSEEITFERFMEYIHPHDRDLLIQTVSDTLQTHKPYTFFHRICTKDGQTKMLHARGEVIKDQQGKVVQLVGTGQDVTLLKSTEKKLLENQNFIRKIADATPAIIASYNIHTGAYSFMNQGLKKLLDYNPQEALDGGVSFFIDLIHPDDLPLITAENQKSVEQANELRESDEEPIVEFKYRMRHRNGEYRWFHTFGTVFERNERQEVEQVLNISLDISEHTKAEQILVQRTRELQQSNASLEEFAYVASHDLKEPLRKISLFVDRLATLRNTYSEEEKQSLDKIMSSSTRMRNMIDDILSLSLISNNKETEHVQLQALLDEVLVTFDDKLEAMNASIRAENLPTVRVIPSQFRQLLQNLISNSLKFSRPGVPPLITITHSYLSPAEVEPYKLRPANRYLRLNLTDNGIGFDNIFQERIFAVFQRLHHKHEYEGTGIGLAICKKVAMNHGGTILANGRVSEGAEFSLIIPT